MSMIKALTVSLILSLLSSGTWAQFTKPVTGVCDTTTTDCTVTCENKPPKEVLALTICDPTHETEPKYSKDGSATCKGTAGKSPAPFGLCVEMDALGPVGREAPFTSYGLGGGIVTVMRTSDPTYQEQIPYSVRLCNTDGGVSLGIWYNATSGTNIPGSGLQTLPFGQCMEVDRPTQLFFHTPTSDTTTVSGTYRLFPAGTFTAVPKNVPYAGSQHSPDGTQVRGKKATGSCYETNHGAPLDPGALPPPPGGLRPNTGYWGYCDAPGLTGGKNFRVCFDTGYSKQPSGQLDYAGSLIPMVLDTTTSIAYPPQPTPDERRYNSVTATGCRDLFNVTTALFVVWTGNWIGENMSSITYTYEELPNSETTQAPRQVK